MHPKPENRCKAKTAKKHLKTQKHKYNVLEYKILGDESQDSHLIHLKDLKTSKKSQKEPKKSRKRANAILHMKLQVKINFIASFALKRLIHLPINEGMNSIDVRKIILLLKVKLIH